MSRALRNSPLVSPETRERVQRIARELHDTLAQELAPFNVQVNAVAPCMVRTGFSQPFWSNDDLLKEIVKSSLEVARIVLARELRLSTRVIEIDASRLSPVDQAVLGNSITLTPGTLTLDASDGRLQVHALTAEGAEALEDGEMLRRVAAIHED